MRKLFPLLMLACLAGCDGSGESGSSGKNSGDNARTAKGLQMPVSAVTLFSGGTAYVEHKGTVTDNATVEVRVKSNQAAGVLKTLIVSDGPTSRPAATVRTIEASSQSSNGSRVDLGQNPTLADLLQQFKGAPVRVTAGQSLIHGTIISLEKKEKSEQGQLNLLTKEGIRGIPLDSMTRVELADERAQTELNRALESLWKPATDDDRKTIAIDLAGTGERSVSFGYALETKPWKTGYRLMLGDKPVLQSLVTVTNDTDADWKNIQLSFQAARPLVLTGDSGPDSAAVTRAAKTAGVPTGESLRRPRPVPVRPIDAAPHAIPPQNVTPEVEPVTPPLDPREVFRRSIAGISVAKKQTVTLPLATEPLAVERVAVFNESLLKRNPLQGARVQNTSKRYLLQGTLAVVEDGIYAGDAMLENLAPGRHGVVTWGIEVPMIVDASEDTVASELAGGKVEDGVLELQRKHVYTKRYVVDNETQKDQTLIIEHAIRRGYTLAEPASPLEFTENLYRFKLAVAAGKRAVLAVKEQATEGETIDLAAADSETIQTLIRTAPFSADLRSVLEKALGIRQRIADQELAAVKKQAEYDQIVAEQNRTRETLKSLSETDALRTKLTDRLDQQDKQLADLRLAIEQAQKDIEKTRESAGRDIHKLNAGK